MENHLQAITILILVSAIVTTAFALWADYYSRSLITIALEDPEYDKGTELQFIRLMGALVMVAQAGNYLLNKEARSTYPVAAILIFLLTVSIQSHVQTGVEKLIRGKNETENNVVPLLLKSGLFAAVAMGVVFALIYFCSLSFFVIAQAFGLSKPIIAVAALAGMFVGVISATVLSYLFAPLVVSKMLPVRSINDSTLKYFFDDCFARAKVSPPNYWIIQGDQSRNYNALIAGFRGPKGFCKAGLFITEGLLKELAPLELESVVCHEAAHLALNHAWRRFLFSLGIVFLSIAALTATFIASQMFIPASVIGVVQIILTLVAVVVPFGLIKQQSRKHELEADVYAIVMLNASFPDMAAALRKIDMLNFQSLAAQTLTLGAGHPATEERIITIRARLEELGYQSLKLPEETKRAA